MSARGVDEPPRARVEVRSRCSTWNGSVGDGILVKFVINAPAAKDLEATTFDNAQNSW